MQIVDDSIPIPTLKVVVKIIQYKECSRVVYRAVVKLAVRILLPAVLLERHNSFF